MFRHPVCSIFRKILVASILGIGVFLIPSGVQSATNNSATLQWAPNQESDLAGYRVYYGKASGIYGSPLDVGNSTTYKFVDLESDATHYFSITAYDSEGNESSPSPEVSLTIPGPESVLSVLISGGGKVTSQPASLSCTNVTCNGTFTQGLSVTLKAEPNDGYAFSGWAGACTGAATCVLTLSAPSASISANFVSTEAPKLVSPALGSTLTTSTATFQWNPGKGVEQYYLSVGTSQGAVDHKPYGDIFSQLTGTNSSQVVSGIPLTGQPVYVRLWWNMGSGWTSTAHTYQTKQVGGSLPQMVSPALGSTLTTSTATFQWNPGKGVEQYYLRVGTSQDAGDIFSQLTGTNSSQVVSGIPLTGQPVYVRLWWNMGSGWTSTAHTYRTR